MRHDLREDPRWVRIGSEPPWIRLGAHAERGAGDGGGARLPWNSNSSIPVTASERRRDPAQPSRLLKKNMWVPVVSEPLDTALKARGVSSGSAQLLGGYRLSSS